MTCEIIFNLFVCIESSDRGRESDDASSSSHSGSNAVTDQSGADTHDSRSSYDSPAAPSSPGNVSQNRQLNRNRSSLTQLKKDSRKRDRVFLWTRYYNVQLAESI